jgi:hypothetical protein
MMGLLISYLSAGQGGVWTPEANENSVAVLPRAPL